MVVDFFLNYFKNTTLIVVLRHNILILFIAIGGNAMEIKFKNATVDGTDSRYIMEKSIMVKQK